jgi:hypothetical protein
MMNLYFLRNLKTNDCAVVAAHSMGRAKELSGLATEDLGVCNLAPIKGVDDEYVIMSTDRVVKVRNAHAIQMSPGNGADDPSTGYKADEYMRGLANGLELAMAILDERDVNYL